MEQNLTPDDVAILIRAKRIQKEKGIKVASVTDICSSAGISRKTGYKWAAQHETEQQDKQRALNEEFSALQSTYAELLENHDELTFQHEGLKLAWQIHRVDEMLQKKKNIPVRKNKK